VTKRPRVSSLQLRVCAIDPAFEEASIFREYKFDIKAGGTVLQELSERLPQELDGLTFTELMNFIA
jgi:hypothetical protein